MKYDPIKKVFGNAVENSPFLRKIFYALLDLMFLRSWHVRKKVRELYPANTKMDIFDAGMGFGQYTYFMAKRFPDSKILAVDVKDEQVRDCKNFFSKCGYKNVKFEIADLITIDYNEKFDFILSVDVMEHIFEDEVVFKNFYNALRKGGKLLVNTPSDLGGSDAHEDDDESFIEEHARVGYSKKDITDKLKRAGFEIESFDYSYGKYGTISWRFGIKYPILIAGASKFFILLLPVYYLFTLWFVLILMWLDVHTDNKEGTGVLVVAQKK
ncbi:MAG: class I SAM-dependent methyltransferase [Ignavibacteria bacterium]|jgi:SAM-dependent methyltransferase|nr:class I SAM-dependent methyltransferase [Ignavibacteria bacterium]